MRPDHVQHTESDVVRIEVVGAHEREIAAGSSAVGRPGIAARRIRPAFRIGRSGLERLAGQRSEEVQVILAAFFQIRLKSLHPQFRGLTNVAVGDPQP
jgi:hypothetical protein